MQTHLVTVTHAVDESACQYNDLISAIQKSKKNKMVFLSRNSYKTSRYILDHSASWYFWLCYYNTHGGFGFHITNFVIWRSKHRIGQSYETVRQCVQIFTLFVSFRTNWDLLVFGEYLRLCAITNNACITCGYSVFLQLSIEIFADISGNVIWCAKVICV